MNDVKMHICPTCGGKLLVNTERQMYECPYCGGTFDYDYFREDNVKDVASKAIRRNEFGSAKDAYDFMLTKDPHDFEALRGLFICKHKWQSMSMMNRDSEVHVSADDPTLKNAIEKCLPGHRPYFEKVREALSELQHYRDLLREDEDIVKRKSVEQSALGNLRSEYNHNSQRFKDAWYEVMDLEPKEREAVLSFAIVLPILVVGAIILNRAWPFLIFFAVMAVFAVGIYHLAKLLTGKHLLKMMVPYEKKIEELAGQHEAKSAEAVQSHDRYKELVHEFMDMDPLAQNIGQSDSQSR
ncbi:MAG: hypothetical protein E7386_08365 [Ruminococcaceae bacterium]|nr:hypothetical protein [Oscillospiraceae bacterium]